jgi:site-specific recombinase XerC
MRIERAIDAYLDWRRIERDSTPRSVDSYRRILFKLAEDYPEIELAVLTTDDLRTFLKTMGANQRLDALERDLGTPLVLRLGERRRPDPLGPSAKIRRAPKRKPDVYRPSLSELARLRSAAFPRERPAIVLMEGAGLRSSEVGLSVGGLQHGARAASRAAEGPALDIPSTGA